ncbi:BRICHOS domain-containing protein 5 isoform X2 [Danio aesculapii]|uniref:BRICHOS domain-containing protein 5 isoform X2 n=1 Tax=Danio aesculapii TaxID=1142201 RepID=UPI0024BF47CF|nr:BRICHOS domain-containing protein 5 isoform X2 [Danio aesculapii]
MVRCWKHSEAGLEEPQRMQCDPTSSSRVPHKVLGLSLAVMLLIVIIALGVTAHLGLQHKTQSSLQVFRIPDHTGDLISQSTVIDKNNNVVTYSVTSHVNHSSTVIFDLRHGLVCYKPDNQDSCFLRRMESWDYENMHSQLNESEQQVRQVWVVGNQTEKHTEFLGVMPGSRVEALSLQEPLQSLCQQASVYWTRRTDGPGKQRLIYFCIDICFPSNICVSVCFYYLPE